MPVMERGRGERKGGGGERREERGEKDTSGLGVGILEQMPARNLICIRIIMKAILN